MHTLTPIPTILPPVLSRYYLPSPLLLPLLNTFVCAFCNVLVLGGVVQVVVLRTAPGFQYSRYSSFVRTFIPFMPLRDPFGL